MTSVADVVISHGCEPDVASLPEWNAVCTQRHSVLFQGPQHATENLLSLLEPCLRSPVTWKRAALPFERPPDTCGTVVLHEVSALQPPEQAALLGWLEGPGERKQVISTSTQPLFPMVVRRRFDERLYYRLAVVFLRVDAIDAPL